MNTIHRSLLASALAVAALGCGSGGDEAGAAAGDSTAATSPAASSGPAMSDPQIARLATLANTADSAAGVVAQQKATNPDVKGFGETMVIDHMNMNKESAALATRLNLAPEETDISRQLKATHDSASADLANRTGDEYDRLYIQHEVATHQRLLATLDRQLIPGAQNAELKALLQKARPAVQAHLERARQIQQRLSGTPPAAAPATTTTTAGT